jgi:hypothetical protein
MMMDLYGNLIDQNLWEAARRINRVSGGTTGRKFRGSLRSHLNHRRRASDQRFCFGAADIGAADIRAGDRAGDRSRTRDILITRSIRAPGRRSRHAVLSVKQAVR